MKSLSVVLLVLVSTCFSQDIDCPAINVCVVDGEEKVYDCNYICCGGQIVEKSAGLSCCGNEEIGSTYVQGEQVCCSWWFTGEYAVYDNNNEGEQCCGTELIVNSMRGNFSCCQGWKNVTLFNYRTEMCCGGIATFVEDTAFGQCCGDVGFDRRTQSCPCGQAPVADVPQNEAQCCRSRDNSVQTTRTNDQGCCDGVAFDPESEFCCNGVIGDGATSACCNGDILPTEPGMAGAGMGCCTLEDGRNVRYNADEQACCGGQLTDLEEGERGLCCDGSLFSNPSDGDSCCNGLPFSSNGSVCCQGVIGVGDSCCVEEAFFGDEAKCCGEMIQSTEGFHQASCCVNVTFDATYETCCGATVYENPTIEGPEGVMNNTSTHTRCCGDFSAPETLRPYDYFNSMCCGGVVHDLGADSVVAMSCCGESTFSNEVEFCCDGITYLRADFGLDTFDIVNCNVLFADVEDDTDVAPEEEEEEDEDETPVIEIIL